mgnify:CR=1 FL=1
MTLVERQFLLPDLGEGLTEAAIVSWLVAPGDIVAIDQMIVEVESAKSIVELPSPYGGRVGELHATAGQTVEKGAPLITILSEADVTTSALFPAPVEGGPAVGSFAGRGRIDSGYEGSAAGASSLTGGAAGGSGAVLVGYGTTESTMRLIRTAGGRFGGRSAGSSAKSPASDPDLLDARRRSPVLSPLIRQRAKAHGFDASHLLGSGPGALVLREDVETAITSIASPENAVPSGHVALPGPTTSPGSPAVGDTRIAISGMRKIISARLRESRQTIPEATIWLDVDATELVRAKAQLLRVTGERFSLTTLIARFVVSGLAKYPLLNSSVDENAQQIVQHGAINLGLAAQTPRGLMVPVVHNAERLTTRQLRDAIASLVEASATGNYPPSALSGGTFTLNNFGSFGVDGSAAIINYPEVAILGIGRIKERPWVVDGQLAVRQVVVLSFAFDHRVCDGDVASGFLTYVARCIEEPLLLIGEV